MERKYLPTFAELVDRLSIVQLKSVFIPNNKSNYDKEMSDIMHDLSAIVREKDIRLTGEMIRAFLVIMLTNRFIWENESKARLGGSEQDKLLKLTHSVNGIRNRAKNAVSIGIGERIDLKLDTLAAELTGEFGNWDIWNDMSPKATEQK